MKKFIILFTLLPFAFSSCLKDDDDVFGKSASERIREVQEGTEKVLNDAPNGWLMEYYPNSKQAYGGITIFLKFDNGVVSVTSEKGKASDVETSLYSYKQDYGPTLNFDTYNPLFHCYTKPNSGVGDISKGMEGDSEFIIMSYAADKIVLRGKKTKNTIILTPLSDGAWKTQFQNYLDAVDKMDGMRSYELVLDGAKYDISRDVVKNYDSRYFTINTSAGNTASFIYTTTGIKFYEPLVIDGKSIAEMTWKDGALVDEASGARIQETASANKFTISVSNVGPLSAKLKVNATVSNEYYYIGVYEKQLETGNSEIDIIYSMMNKITSMSDLQKGSEVKKDLTLKSKTEYVPCAFGVKVVNGFVYPTTALAKGTAFTTPELVSAKYEDWIGTWTVTSTSSEEYGTPITFDIVVSQKVAGSSYSVIGWDITQIRNDFPVTANFDATAGGALSFPNYQLVGTNGNGPHYFLAEILYPGDTDYYLATDNYNLPAAMEGTLDNTKTAGVVNGATAVDPWGDTYNVTTMCILVKTSTGWGSYGPATGFAGDYPVGPFTLVKKSSSGAPAAPKSAPNYSNAPLHKAGRVK